MSGYTIGLSTTDEVGGLPGIERRAATLFSADDLAAESALETTPLPIYAQAQREARLFVARDPAGQVVGFAHLIRIARIPHLEELDVEPESGRRGIGRMLVLASCDWARAQGSEWITLSTFRDVPWNAPFYARLGFVEIPEVDLSVELRRLREKEAREGLDPAKRIIMCRRTSGTEH